jgi:hypothetical protein
VGTKLPLWLRNLSLLRVNRRMLKVQRPMFAEMGMVEQMLRRATMNVVKKTSRLLGGAFLIQFVTSFSNGVFLQPTLIVPGNISETMLRVASHPALMKVTILLDMMTALGVIFLGAMLFTVVRGIHEKLALTALGFYILEGSLLAGSQMNAFALLRISQEYSTIGQPTALQIMATLALESGHFVGATLHTLAFCAGAILFYSLLTRSSTIPRWISFWGLITVIPVLIMTLLALFNYQVPFILALPYVPFELVIGVWLLLKGVPEPALGAPNSLALS